jgi:8-oxo-dGTP pyrophosphatase MutT (NUDIX family)
MSEPAEITFAAGVIAKALTTNRILMGKRTDTGEWAFPGSRIEGDETASR